MVNNSDAATAALLVSVQHEAPEHVAYTVGAERSYDEALSAGGSPSKLGKSHDGYGGGWVWRSENDARAFIGSAEFCASFARATPPLCAVYELALPAPWEAAVSQEPEAADGVHRLIVDARIVRKVKHVV